MKVSDICSNYFKGFQEVKNYKRNDRGTNILAVLKIISYFTAVIPIGFAAVYGTASLYGRATKIKNTHPNIQAVHSQAVRQLKADDQASKSKVETDEQGSKPKVETDEQGSKPKVETPVLEVARDLSELPRVDFPKVMKIYNPGFRPQANRINLQEYSQSEDFKRHAQTARIYYNPAQLTEDDALRVIFQREPTNIAMGSDQYNAEELKQLFGYNKSVYNDSNVTKVDGSLFRELPNTATVYSETYLWDPPGGDNKKEIACLSLPAPALDSEDQPHYPYYMSNGKLDKERYTQEMEFLFKVIEKVVRDHKDSAFENKGIRRLVLSRFGQGAFLEALSQADRKVAREIYKTQLRNFLENIKDTEVEVVMSEYSDPGSDIWHDRMIIGDVIKTAREGDLVINAWDPHSAPGNGNDADRSFDGAMGKASGILLTQTSWLNETLRTRDAVIQVE